MSRGVNFSTLLLTCALIFNCSTSAYSQKAASITGTLVVAVPFNDGLVVCSDKRLFNADARTFTDNNVKLRKVDDKTLFAATNTVGFYDAKAKKMAFDAFEVTSGYIAKNDFSPGQKFWEGLKKEINDRLRSYLREREFADWPASDRANDNLLFNLIFFSIRGGAAWSHSIKVYYEKARVPVVRVAGPVSEQVRTTKLSGKGREVMSYISRNSAGIDASILKFDESRFDVNTTTEQDALDFARKLIRITSSSVPRANVSAASDCAILSQTSSFRWAQDASTTSRRSHPQNPNPTLRERLLPGKFSWRAPLIITMPPSE